MNTSLAATEDFLHGKIPLARAMGVRVASHDATGLLLTAPLAENHNHLGTAFGGSISAIATLAGYALLWRELEDQSAHIVIRSSSLSYEQPIHGDLHALCLPPATEAMDTFRARFHKAGKARILIRVILSENGTPSAIFEGEYVALR